MKQTSAYILQFLKDEPFHQSLIAVMDANPSAVHGDVDMSEIRTTYESLRSLIIQGIENESFDLIPYNRRNAMWTHLTNLKNNVGNPQQVIAQVEALQDQINISGLYYLNVGNRNIRKQLDELTILKRRYTSYVKDFEETRKTLDFLAKKRTELDQLVQTAQNTATQIATIQTDANTKFQGIDSVLQQAETQKQSVLQKAQEVEDKKVAVNTFSNSIDTYKSTIDELTKQCKAIIDKDKEISSLISKAENALQLREAEGISAAFSARFSASSNKWIYIAWLSGAVLLLLLALVGTAWIITGWKLAPDAQNSIASIIGRIVAVGVTITGATFCANQFVRQKSLAEDYAYKATLSKSIVAFSNEIKKSDQSQLASYLKQVLHEIHQDPLRNRGKKEKDGDEVNLEVVKKVTELLKIVKPDSA